MLKTKESKNITNWWNIEQWERIGNCGDGVMIDNQRFNDQQSQTEYDPENYKI